jgi:hypothetical protein
MTWQSDLGRLLFAMALLAFALQHLGFATGIALPAPGPPWVVGPLAPAYLMALALLAGSAAIVFRFRTMVAAATLGLGFVIYGLAACLPAIVRDVHAPGGWASGAELLSLGGALLVISAGSSPGAGENSRWAPTLRRGGRSLYAVPLLVFAAQHFIYAKFIAGLVPAWIPGHLFWAYLVGVGFIAASAAIVTGRLAWWAASLLGIQFLTWVVVLHLPRALAAHGSGKEWTSLFVAMAMGGGAWAIAGATGGMVNETIID